MSDNDGHDFDCELCRSKQMDDFRNCNGTSNPSFRMKTFDKVWTRCPLQHPCISYMPILTIIAMCEGGGFGGGRVMPDVLLEQSEKYFAFRYIVLSEQQRVEKLREEKEKKRG